MSLSTSMDFNAVDNLGNSLDQIPLMLSQTRPSIITQGSGEKNRSQSSYTDFEFLDSEPLYNSIMEWILNKTPSNLDSQLMIDDQDKIANPHSVQLLYAFYQKANESLKSKMIQDIYMLVKWSQNNCGVLLGLEEFHRWLLDVLLEEQIHFFNQEIKGCHAAVGLRRKKNY
jgi:hypothetical protein